TGDDERRRQTHARWARTPSFPTLSHPDSYRRPRVFTWSAPRWLQGVRGLSPPVGTCTQPRGLSVVSCPQSVSPLQRKCNVFYFRRRVGSVRVPALEQVERVRGDRQQDLESLDRAARRAREVADEGSTPGAGDGA